MADTFNTPIPGLLEHFPDGTSPIPGGPRRRRATPEDFAKMDRSKSTLELEDEHDVEISLADSATFALDEQRRRREAKARRQQDIERARKREQEREQQRNSQAAFQPTNPLTLAPDAKGPGGIATGFDGNQAQPFGRLPNPGAGLRQGTVTTSGTDSVLGKSPEASRPSPTSSSRSAVLEPNHGGDRSKDKAASESASPPQTTFAAFFRQQLEQLTGRPWDDLVRDGQNVIAAALRPQSAMQGNVPIPTPDRAGSSSVVLHGNEITGNNFVQFAEDGNPVLPSQVAQGSGGRRTTGSQIPGRPNSPLTIPLSTPQLSTHLRAQTVLQQIREIRPSYNPQRPTAGAAYGEGDLLRFEQVLFRLKAQQLQFESMHDVDYEIYAPDEAIRREFVILTYVGKSAADRLFTHVQEPNHPDENRRTYLTSLKVPPGAKVDRSVLQTGIPLGFDTKGDFRLFRNVVVDEIQEAARARVGELAAEKLKVGIRGSSISGRKFERERGPLGRGFNSESDFDIFIISKELFAKFTELTGVPVRKGAVHVDVKIRSTEADELGLDRLLRAIKNYSPLRNEPSIRIFKNGAAPNAMAPRQKGPALPGPATLLLNS